MKRMNAFFALMLGALVTFTACDKDDELTPEQQEAKQKEELLQTIKGNVTTIVTKKWTVKEFENASELTAAAGNDDATAATIIAKRAQADNFKLALTFAVESDSLKVDVAINLTEEELAAKLLDYQTAIAGFPLDFLLETSEFYQASVRRIIAAPFAPDEATIEDIVNEDTGKCVLKVVARDFEALAYDDLVLAQKKLVKDNNDKIYMNEDGTLTVEITHEKYGVSKMILKEVTE